MAYTTIMLNSLLKERLASLKVHHNESYNEVVEKLVEFYEDDQRLKIFVREAQRKKMKELWDNDKDEVWENA